MGVDDCLLLDAGTGSGHWFEQLDLLVEYRKAHVWWPHLRDVEHRDLARWFHDQRDASRSGLLTPGSHAALDAALTGWDDPHGAAERWEAFFDAACEFRLSLPERWPARHDPTERELCRWIETQRTALRQDHLASDRRVRLDAALGDWRGLGAASAVRRDANTIAGEVLAYADHHGHRPIRSCGANGYRLAHWLHRHAVRPRAVAPNLTAQLAEVLAMPIQPRRVGCSAA